MPTLTSEVELRRLSPLEGIVLLKISSSLFWIVATVIGVALIVFAITNYYFNVAT